MNHPFWTREKLAALVAAVARDLANGGDCGAIGVDMWSGSSLGADLSAAAFLIEDRDPAARPVRIALDLINYRRTKGHISEKQIALCFRLAEELRQTATPDQMEGTA
ncbi:MAG: hypothetical protein ACYCTF_07475 [Acidiferrobacter sp.]